MSHSALILFAHGSRDPEWAAPFQMLKKKIETTQPQLRVELAFLEFMQPSIVVVADQLAGSAQRVMIAPLFMSQGAHLKRDLANLVAEARRRHPAVEFEVLPSVGEMDAVLNAISSSIGHAAARPVTP